ncbi:amidohydrolase family protein [Mycolicibacterium helvum]|uniref:Amidohydrolase n=1 Tax=Mycolicibacterium helvum TaxID=1534349 RepID=A0A7I7TBV9_9MYCO|nr:amidohydrolase family protein [Mycolicibacterium helvum]BBY65845.1 amidohydrolase [Mycolicibacterium helvum]
MAAPNRIDVHQHVLPPVYVDWLRKHHIDDAGGRALPDWSAKAALALMDQIGTSTAILSVSTPGTGPATDASEAARVAREVNDFSAELVKDEPDRFGFFATLTLPHLDEALAETARALDDLGADGVTLLANTNGDYLGQPEHEELFAELDRRSAVVFIHPAELPGPAVDGIPPFAADFLLDTTRAAFLLVRNGIRHRYPNIKFILSHAGGFVPYASHRMALTIFGESVQQSQDLMQMPGGVAGRSLDDVLADFSGFYFDIALSGSPAALPSLLAFADPGHVLFGSDFPFAPPVVVQYFTATGDTYVDADHSAINRNNAAALFPRLAKR